MLKTALLAIVPVCMMATVGIADDDLFAELSDVSIDQIADADIAIEEAFADVDVDALLDGTEEGEDAMEACFRRFGYRSYGYGYGHGYSYGCYRPVYRNYYCHRPVYSYSCYPTYSYWGCY